MDAGARLEQELPGQEALLRELTENIYQVFWLASADQRQMFYVSPSYNHIFGGSCDGLLREPMSWLEAVHPDDRPHVEAEVAREYGQRFTREYRIIRRDGAIRWILSRGYPVRDKRGRICRVAGLAEDITERKQAEEALKESETRYRCLFKNMLDGFLYCRLLFEGGQPQDFIVLEVNQAFEELTGLKNVAGRKASEVIPGFREADPDLFERYGRVALTGRPERFEIYLTKLKRWFSVSAYCPKKEHFIAVFDNITERKEAEERLHALAQEIVAAREDERKQVSSALHHDAGSLAVGISAYFDAIEKDLRTGDPKEALKWVTRTRKLFDKAVARLKGLAVEIRPPELDVLGLRAALRQYFSRITKQRSTRIRFRQTQDRLAVSANAATILFRVAQEALTNAIKHGHAKHVDVDLRTSKEEIRLTVRDDGKGFDPSEQNVRATSQLGLRVMREMAASAGGAITIDSRQGRGTIVRLSLPDRQAAPRLDRSLQPN
jgi:PAS domain S-box-containing protein